VRKQNLIQDLIAEHENFDDKSTLTIHDENDFEKKTISSVNRSKPDGNHDGVGLSESNNTNSNSETLQTNTNSSILSHHLKPIDFNLIKDQLASSKNLNTPALLNSNCNKTTDNVKPSMSSESIKSTNSHGSYNHGLFLN
jgi:hypothetical protein